MRRYYRMPEKGALVVGQGFETGRTIIGKYDLSFYLSSSDGLYKVQAGQVIDANGAKNAVALFTMRDATKAEESAFRLTTAEKKQ